MSRQAGRIEFGVRMACVSVMLLLSVVCGKATEDVGASLKIDSRLSLLEEQESMAWANYAKALLCRHDETYGFDLYKRYIGEALDQAPDSEYLYEQWSLGRDLQAHPEKHLPDLRKIWDSHQENVRLTMHYVDLLVQADRNKEALEAVLLCQTLNKWKSGILALRYIELAQIGDRSPMVEDMLHRTLTASRGKDYTDALIAAGCYWRDCHETAQTFLHDAKTGRFRRIMLKLSCTRFRRKSLWHARKAAARLGDLESMSAFALSGIFGSFDCHEEQLAYLTALDEADMQDVTGMVWYFIDICHALREQGEDDDLRELLSHLEFGQDWHEDVLQCAADSYMALHDYERACEMFEMISRKDPRNIPSRLMIANLSLHLKQSVKGLAALAPLHGLPPAGCELKASLLAQHGENEKAYEEYMSLLKIHEKGDFHGQWAPGASFYNGLVMNCLDLKKRDEALKYVKALYELDTEDAHSCNFYGYLLADFNRELDLAETLIRKALLQEPDNVAYIDSLAWVRFRQGRYAEALEEMLKILEKNGMEMDSDGELSEHLAAILKTFGFEQTAEFYQRQADKLKK